MNSCSHSVPKIGKSLFTFSSGEFARQADGSVLVSYGDTIALVTVCVSKKPSDSLGFLPLTVDYQEKTYAMGKIPGGYIKKEGRPKDEEILAARLIDRPIRSLFPKGFTNSVQIIAMVLSSDSVNDPDVLALNGASCALGISGIPFPELIGTVRVASINGEFVINPTYQERDKSSMEMVVVGNQDKIVMLEGKFDESSEDEVIKAIEFARPFIQQLIAGQREFIKKIGRKKKEFPLHTPPEDLYVAVKEYLSLQKLEELYGLSDRDERAQSLDNMLDELYTFITEEKKIETTPDEIKAVFYDIEREFVRKKILYDNVRPDSRKIDQIRDINCEVGVLPRTHGSGIFTRGQTQSLAITTLGTSSDEQLIEALEGKQSKHFMLHYFFPPFSVGEVKGLRGPSRREIGHGALAEKAIVSMLPSKEEFPYTIRVVSEILESNGSSSMATVCATSLSLMDAGVPVKKPVAGIALGLVKDDEKYTILTDIAGVEDHYGDMDFKIAGTEDGVCTIQVDVKNNGLDMPLIQEALSHAKEARLIILQKMKDALSLPRKRLSKYAPKIKAFKIDSNKIGEIIGPGGRTIRKLTRDFNVNIDIDDETSMVSVVAETEEDLERAVNTIRGLAKEVQVGEIYEGTIAKITNFGAFCDFLPNKSGLIHISEIADKYVKDVRDYLKEGDIVKVKIINIDPQGKITLSIKQAG